MVPTKIRPEIRLLLTERHVELAEKHQELASSHQELSEAQKATAQNLNALISTVERHIASHN